MLGLILQPMPANSYWTDSDNDGIPEEIANPPEGDSWWADDSDGDGMTNAEEVVFLSDPYRLDSDFDGLTDRDERDLTPPVLFGGLAHTDPWDWDSNDNGYSDHDEYFYALQARTLDVNYSTLTQFYSYSDADGDGVHNQDDSAPLTMDRDGDGIVNWQDSYMDDYYNGFPPPIDPWYYADDDNDGTINGNDPFPGDWWNGQPHYYWDGAERSGTWSDQDADGIPDDFDPTPLPGYTYNGAFYAGTWSDRDGDGVPDPADPTPDGTYWYGGQEYTGPWTDSDNDGIPNPADSIDSSNSHWYNGTEYEGPFVDTDGDTIPDSADSWPSDPENGLDSDGDGLENHIELNNTHTDPNDVDSDDDSLTDGEEALITHSNPNDPTTGENQTVLDFFAFSGPDTDNDGLPDFVESHYATSNEPNPTTWLAVSGDLDGDGVTNLQAYWFGWDLLAYLNQYDMDGDGMTDAQEDYWSSLYPGIMDRAVFADAVGDYDNDDVLNFEEVALGMHPASAYFNRGYWYPPGSTDPVWQDGAPDFMYWWFLTHFIPAQAAGSTDPSGAIQLAWHDGDGNGIPDAMEQSPGSYLNLPNGRDPLHVGDYDGDGMTDVWEHRHGLALRDASDARADSDNDQLSNRDEHAFNTHPRIADSDGDGYHDGLEVRIGAQPVDPAHTPISRVTTLHSQVLANLSAYQALLQSGTRNYQAILASYQTLMDSWTDLQGKLDDIDNTVPGAPTEPMRPGSPNGPGGPGSPGLPEAPPNQPPEPPSTYVLLGRWITVTYSQVRTTVTEQNWSWSEATQTWAPSGPPSIWPEAIEANAGQWENNSGESGPISSLSEAQSPPGTWGSFQEVSTIESAHGGYEKGNATGGPPSPPERPGDFDGEEVITESEMKIPESYSSEQREYKLQRSVDGSRDTPIIEAFTVTHATNPSPPDGSGTTYNGGPIALHPGEEESDESIVLEAVPGVASSAAQSAAAPASSGTVSHSKSASATNFSIVPDASMYNEDGSGKLGDVVPSIIDGSMIKHFVTPKDTPDDEIPEEYVILKAGGLSDADFETGPYSWDCDGGGPGASAKEWKVKRDSPRRVVVKIVGPGSETEMHVWVVWADGKITEHVDPTPIPDPPKNTRIMGGARFEFTISPNEVIDQADHPNLEGPFDPVTAPLPGKNLTHVISGESLEGGAFLKWDVTRQFRVRIYNPHLYPASSLPKVNANSRLWAGQPDEVTTPEDYPSTPTIGNDDIDHLTDEINDPYTNGGKVTSFDFPTASMLTATGENQHTFRRKYHFREIVRLNIGTQWFRVSDYVEWRIHYHFKKIGNEWHNDDQKSFFDDDNLQWDE